MNRNMLYVIIGALIVIVGVLGYMTYQDRKQPEGVQISIGKEGVDIKSK
jgi:RsiW-degrading membrane proteinase PrsW (M82 family)